MDDYRKRHREAYERRMREQQEASARESCNADSSSPALRPGQNIAPDDSVADQPPKAPSDDGDRRPDHSKPGEVGGAAQLAPSGPDDSTLSNSVGTGETGASSSDGGVSRRFAQDDDLASMEEARRLQRQFDGEAEGYRAPDAAYQECLISDEPGPEDMYSGTSAGVAALLFGSSAAAPTGTESSASGGDSAIQGVIGEAGMQADAEMSDEDFARRLQEAEYGGAPQASPQIVEGPSSASFRRQEATEGPSERQQQWTVLEDASPAAASPTTGLASRRAEQRVEGVVPGGLFSAPTQAAGRVEAVEELGGPQHPVQVEDTDSTSRTSPTAGNLQNPIALDDPDEALLQAAIAQSLIDM